MMTAQEARHVLAALAQAQTITMLVPASEVASIKKAISLAKTRAGWLGRLNYHEEDTGLEDGLVALSITHLRKKFPYKMTPILESDDE